MRICLLCILISGCSSLSSFRSDPRQKEFTQYEEDEVEKAIAVVDEKPAGVAVQWMHWRCCLDLCKRIEPKEVFKERDTNYVICTCKTGKVFRVTKLK